MDSIIYTEWLGGCMEGKHIGRLGREFTGI